MQFVQVTKYIHVKSRPREGMKEDKKKSKYE
jgi:hypothetical protein